MARRLFFLAGFVSTLPSIYFYGLCLGIYTWMLAGRIESKIAHKGVLFGLISILCVFQGGMLLGLYANEPEARLFLVRALLATMIILMFIFALDGQDEVGYFSYLHGVFVGIVFNAIAVLIFAMSPEVYESLRVSSLTGFDKGARLLRSPGLQAGTDTAGYLTVLGIVIHLYLARFRVRGFLLNRKTFYLLLITPLFCSRSSMLLAATIMVLLLVAWNRHIARPEKTAMFITGSVVASVGAALVGALFFPEALGLEPTTQVFGVPIDAIYMVMSSDDYVGQYDFYGMFSVIPTGGAELYDNTIGKLLASAGVFGFGAGCIVITYSVFALLFATKGVDRTFTLFYLFIFLFAIAKNNYLFYTFFVAMTSVLLCRSASRHRQTIRSPSLLESGSPT